MLNKMSAGKQHVVFMHYDDLSDAIMFMFVSPETKTTVHYIDENVALLYNPDNNEVVGIQVEDFQTSFVDEYTNVKTAWSLRDSCQDLQVQNLGDINLVVERRKPVVAREVAKITEDLLKQGGEQFSPCPAD